MSVFYGIKLTKYGAELIQNIPSIIYRGFLFYFELIISGF